MCLEFENRMVFYHKMIIGEDSQYCLDSYCHCSLIRNHKDRNQSLRICLERDLDSYRKNVDGLNFWDLLFISLGLVLSNYFPFW